MGQLRKKCRAQEYKDLEQKYNVVIWRMYELENDGDCNYEEQPILIENIGYVYVEYDERKEIEDKIMQKQYEYQD